MALTLLILVGAFLGWLYERGPAGPPIRNSPRMGVLAATGLIVGESLFGVAFAGIVAASGSDAPLALVGEHIETYAIWIGPVLFAATIAWLYARTKRSAAQGLRFLQRKRGRDTLYLLVSCSSSAQTVLPIPVLEGTTISRSCHPCSPSLVRLAATLSAGFPVN